MDGGGRYLRPLSAGSSGRARVAGVPPVSRMLSKLNGRLPRLVGTGLTLAFFAAVAITGLIVGGRLQDFRERYGEPRHAFARVLGLGIDQVTISGIAQLSEAE